MNWFKNKDKRISELEDKNNTLENLYSAVNIMNEELKNKLEKLEEENRDLKEALDKQLKYTTVIDTTNDDINIKLEGLKKKLEISEKENKQLREWFNGILEKYGDRQCVDSLIPYYVKHEKDITRMERKENIYVPPIEITNTKDIMDEIEESFNRWREE